MMTFKLSFVHDLLPIPKNIRSKFSGVFKDIFLQYYTRIIMFLTSSNHQLQYIVLAVCDDLVLKMLNQY